MKAYKTNLYKKTSKILRVPFSPQEGKRVMSNEDFHILISGEVVIEEKLDGATYCIELEEEKDMLLFGEYLKIKHSIKYDEIPLPRDARFLWYVIFDIYDKSESRFLTTNEKKEYADVYGFVTSRILYTGFLDIQCCEEMIRNIARQKSGFGSGMMEGVVIKNYANQHFGKYINEEFRIEVNYREKPLEENQLSVK